jgi:hypothetical protein
MRGGAKALSFKTRITHLSEKKKMKFSVLFVLASWLICYETDSIWAGIMMILAGTWLLIDTLPQIKKLRRDYNAKRKS